MARKARVGIVVLDLSGVAVLGASWFSWQSCRQGDLWTCPSIDWYLIMTGFFVGAGLLVASWFLLFRPRIRRPKLERRVGL